MDGARAEEMAARDMVARLCRRPVSPWTVAELFMLGDRAVDDLEGLAYGAFGAATEDRSLGAKILAAIGTPAARAALRRVLAACGASPVGAPESAGDRVVAHEVASYLSEPRGTPTPADATVDDTVDARGSDRAA